MYEVMARKVKQPMDDTDGKYGIDNDENYHVVSLNIGFYTIYVAQVSSFYLGFYSSLS